jgi:small GTP-binding protein
MSKSVYNYVLKFIIVGNSSVGKSNILSKFTDKRFQSSYDITIGVEFATKMISRQNIVYKLQIWDTAGQEAFRSITRSYYRGTIGCLLVYDISQRETFDILHEWLGDLKKYCDPSITIALIGNKVDLIEKRVVTKEEGEKFAKDNNLLFFETSAKTGENIETSFIAIIDQIAKKIETNELKLISTDNINLKKDKNNSNQSCYC